MSVVLACIEWLIRGAGRMPKYFSHNNPKNNRKKFLLISWRMPRSNSTRMEITGITWMWRLPLMNKRKSWKDFWKSKSSFFFCLLFVGLYIQWFGVNRVRKNLLQEQPVPTSRWICLLWISRAREHMHLPKQFESIRHCRVSFIYKGT